MSNQNRYYPISVQSGIPHLSETPKGWKKEPLEKHLIEIKRPAEMVNDKQYQLITVKRSRGGVEERAKLFGKDIKVKSQFYVQTGDFLISKRQIVHGACGLVPNELNGALVSGEYSVLGTNGGMNIAYLKYLSESVYFQQTCFQSSIGVHVEKMVFKIDRWLKWDFNIPPLHEQKKIADILTTVDDKISSIDSQIQQTEQLKKGLMEKLLTEGIGHTEFKETEIGRVPIGWDVVRFEKILVLQRGFDLPVKKRTKGKYPLIASNGVIDSHSEFKIKGPGVITGRSGTLGKVHYIENDYWPLNTTLYSKEMYDNNPRFLYYFLKHFNIAKYGTGTGVPTLNRNNIHKLDVARPTLPEQKQIATILTTVDDKLDILTKKKAQYQTLKKGLSQQLLTGQMRVKV